MSTVQVSNITDGTNSVETVYVARGSAKAWVNFNGTGTIAARDSFNLSSLTDNGVGNYSVTLTNSMSDGNYMISVANGRPVLSSDGQSAIYGTPIASGYAIAAVNQGDLNFKDFDYMHSNTLGDLA